MTMYRVTMNTSTSKTWPANDRAILIPFVCATPTTIKRVSVNIGVQSGNFDIGIYDSGFNLLTSLGSTAVPAAGIANLALGPVTLTPGLYYMAMACNNTTVTFNAFNTAADLGIVQATGAVQMASAFPLPSTVTPAAMSSSYFYLMKLLTTTTNA